MSSLSTTEGIHTVDTSLNLESEALSEPLDMCKSALLRWNIIAAAFLTFDWLHE